MTSTLLSYVQYEILGHPSTGRSRSSLRTLTQMMPWICVLVPVHVRAFYNHATLCVCTCFGNYMVNSLALCLSGPSVSSHIALGPRKQHIKGESMYVKKDESKKEDKGF